MVSVGMSRRRVLGMVGGAVAVGSVSDVGAAQSEVSLSGRVVAFDGDPVAGRKLNASSSTAGDYFETDPAGRFETTVESESGGRLALYKSSARQLHAPERNGVPHIYVVTDYYARSESEDLGTLSVPRGFRVDMRALRADGSPATDATFDFRANYDNSWFGASRHWLETDDEGYLVIRNADFTGVELAGSATVTVEIPSESGSTRKFQKTLNVDQPLTVTAQVGEGLTVEQHEVPKTTTSEDTTTTTAVSTTPDDSTAAESTTPTDDATSTSDGGSTTSDGAAGSETTASNGSDGAADQPSRGFFSNEGPESEVEFLNDPFVLTVGGFALSILGVLQNMVR